MTKEAIAGLPAEELLTYEFATQEQIDCINYTLQQGDLVEGGAIWTELMVERSNLYIQLLLIHDELDFRQAKEEMEGE